MTQTPQSEEPSLAVTLSHRELSDDVRRRREAARAENERIEAVVKPRIEAQLQACRIVLEQLMDWHREVADSTDLDLTGHSRASAIWLLSGRCLGLLEALLVLAEAGIEAETMVMGRALHEADLMLLAFLAPDEEDIVRLWLRDEGRHRYVRPATSRAVQGQFEEQMDEVFQEQGLPSIGRTGPLADELYDRLSRVTHSRRSSCTSSVNETLREFSYGRHASPIRRGSVVELSSVMTQEVVNAVGDGIRAFRSPGFFSEEVQPLYLSIEAVRRTCPLDHESVQEDAARI